MRFSVIITNFNYASFVSAAIDSALALRWDDVEVIVVDDASTDGSRSVIAAYGDRVIALLAETNAGQRESSNRGFDRSSGDVVLFLDSDDVLDPRIAERVMAVWTPSAAKVQVQMERVDSEGASLHSVSPRFRRTPTPEQIRRWWTRTTAYPTPPGSANAYSRSFLERVMPVSGAAGEFIDSVLLASAPLFGDVLTVPEPLVRYRIHQRNDSDLLHDPRRFAREVRRALDRHRYALALVGDTSPVLGRLRRSRELLQFRIASRRLAPDEPALPGDTRRRMLLDAVRSVLQPGPELLHERILISTWCVVVLLAPVRVAGPAITWRYNRA